MTIKNKIYTQEEMDVIIRKNWKRKNAQFTGAVLGYLLGLLICIFVL